MNKLVLLSSMVMIGTGIVRGGESLRSEETLERERIEPLVVDTTGDRDITGDEVGVGDEVDEIDVDDVVERGGYAEEIQMEIGALLKMLNRRITKVIAIANEREETLREIRMMVNRCGNMHFFRQAVIERIYDTAWTINGRPVLGRTEGWRWSEIGTDDTTHGTGGQVTIITQAYANGRRAPLQWATVGRTQEDYYYDGVMRGPQTGARIDWLCTAANIPLLPKHKKGEMAIITFYTDSSYSPSPEWQGDWGGGHIVEAMTLEKSVSVTSGLTGIQMYTFNMTRGEGYYALLELPVSRALRTTIDNPGDGYTLGMPRGMRWRAIVGEYVAP